MNLNSYLFYDRSDDTETEVVCENLDTALILFCKYFELIFLIEEIEQDGCNKNGFPRYHVSGTTEGETDER